MQKPVQKNDFSQGNIPSTIARMAVPLIAAQLINVLYSVVDRIYIARIPHVGLTVLAGVGLTFPIVTLISAFTALAGQGGAPLFSMARGEGQDERAGRIMGNSMLMLLFFAVFCTIVSYLVKTPLLRLFGASDDTLPYAQDYLNVYLLGTPFVMAALGMNPFINAQGFTRVGMMSVLIGALTNVALDPLFIFVFNMGVKGAAVATIISQALSAAWTLIFLTGRRSLIRLRFSLMKPDFHLMGRIAALGLSSCTMSVTESLVQAVCNASLGQTGGDVYITVMTVINSIRQIIMMPISGFSQAAAPVMSYNYGAKRIDRVRTCFRVQIVTTLCMSIAAWALAQLAPELLIRLFNGDEALMSVGVPAVRLYFATFCFMFMQMSCQHSFVALGKARRAMFFSLLRKAFIVAPLAVVLPRFMGARGVFAAEAISDVVGSSACFITFMLTVWRTELSPRLDAARTQPPV